MDKKALLKTLTEQFKEVSDTPLLDARFLMEEASDEAALNAFVQRRLSGEPVFKILGHRGFWKGDFKVSKDTLDPRPDTETLIEAVLKQKPFKAEPYRILDLGTGTGCLLLSLLEEYPHATGIGVDASEKALEVARENGKNCPRVHFQKGSWFEKNWTKAFGMFDMIVSNPPYIPSKEIENLDTEVKNYDPLMALDGGVDGLDAYRALAEGMPVLLKEKALAFFEIGKGQEKAVTDIMTAKGLALCASYKDLGGIIRCLVFEHS